MKPGLKRIKRQTETKKTIRSKGVSDIIRKVLNDLKYPQPRSMQGDSVRRKKSPYAISFKSVKAIDLKQLKLIHRLLQKHGLVPIDLSCTTSLAGGQTVFKAVFKVKLKPEPKIDKGARERKAIKKVLAFIGDVDE